jgi:hypothetical protein
MPNLRYLKIKIITIFLHITIGIENIYDYNVVICKRLTQHRS